VNGAATLAPIVRALGGDLWGGGRRANVPGPGHGARDRSVSLLLARGRVVVHCFAGDDWRDVLADLRARGLVDAEGHVTGSAADHAPQPPGRTERVRTARGLWAGGGPLAGTLSERHLRLRGVAGWPQDLRHHPAVPAAVYASEGARRPALLAAIRESGQGEVVGVEVTYLAANGERARLRLARKTIGLCPPGAAVRLAPAAPEILVGEGVFTCLSASERFGLPAWALLAVRNLRAWRAPAGVRRVVIAADRGRVGEAAAAALARRLRRQGVDVAVRWPPAPHGDWNEAARAGGEGEEGRDRAGAADGRSGPPARRSSP
jgi:putative DNA primase/helicase